MAGTYLDIIGHQWTRAASRTFCGMRINVEALARAQGVQEDLRSIQALRRGLGVTSANDLCGLTPTLKQHMLGLYDESDAELEVALSEFRSLVDKAPPRERELLRLCFNFDQEHGRFRWLARVDNFSSDTEWVGSARDVRNRADTALLQLVLRSRPAGESEPDDFSEARRVPSAGRRSFTALNFFTEDYVRNSATFENSLSEAKTLDICGFGHNRMGVSYSNEILHILIRGGRVRVLAQDPERDAVLEANRRSSTPKAADDDVRVQSRGGIATMRAIFAAATSGEAAMRVYDWMPPFTGYFFDADGPEAHAYIWFWSWRQPSSWRPGFRVDRSTDALWHDRFGTQFESMWTESASSAVDIRGEQ